MVWGLELYGAIGFTVKWAMTKEQFHQIISSLLRLLVSEHKSSNPKAKAAKV